MMNRDRMEVINVEVAGSAWWSMQSAETVTSRLPIKTQMRLLASANFSPYLLFQLES